MGLSFAALHSVCIRSVLRIMQFIILIRLHCNMIANELLLFHNANRLLFIYTFCRPSDFTGIRRNKAFIVLFALHDIISKGLFLESHKTLPSTDY